MAGSLDTSLVIPSLIGDAIALGPHWVYDPALIAERLGRCDRFHDPISTYHPGKKAGDQTHYGDQTLWLVESLQTTGTWSSADYLKNWTRRWQTGTSYRDKATRSLLETGLPYASLELGGAARLAPLLSWLADRPQDERIRAAREQTTLTHASALASDAAEFITRTVDGLRSGLAFLPALQQAADEGRYLELDPASSISSSGEVPSDDPIAAVGSLGQACGTAQALPAVIYLARHLGEKPVDALTWNARAGGDSAARGLVLGLWLGARHGSDWIPPAWLQLWSEKSPAQGLF
jgi:ADP-ribosylglycohydrolase